MGMFLLWHSVRPRLLLDVHLVIAVAPTFSGGNGHAGTAGTFKQAGQKGRGGDDPGGSDGGGTLNPELGNLVKNVLADDRLNVDFDPLGFGLASAGFAFRFVEEIFPDIGPVRKQIVDA